MSGCNKVRYATEKAANAALLRAQIKRQLHGNQRRRECRSYPCPQCEGHHLTSRPLVTGDTA